MRSGRLGHSFRVQAFLDKPAPLARSYAGQDPLNKIDPDGMAARNITRPGLGAIPVAVCSTSIRTFGPPIVVGVGTAPIAVSSVASVACSRKVKWIELTVCASGLVLQGSFVLVPQAVVSSAGSCSKTKVKRNAKSLTVIASSNTLACTPITDTQFFYFAGLMGFAAVPKRNEEIEIGPSPVYSNVKKYGPCVITRA